jgi:hypothetical protein
LIPIPSSHDDCDADESNKSMNVLTKINETIEINEESKISKTINSSAIVKLDEATDLRSDMRSTDDIPLLEIKGNVDVSEVPPIFKTVDSCTIVNLNEAIDPHSDRRSTDGSCNRLLEG